MKNKITTINITSTLAILSLGVVVIINTNNCFIPCSSPESINEMILNISYSYLVSYITYFITIYIPEREKANSINKMLHKLASDLLLRMLRFYLVLLYFVELPEDEIKKHPIIVEYHDILKITDMSFISAKGSAKLLEEKREMNRRINLILDNCNMLSNRALVMHSHLPVSVINLIDKITDQQFMMNIEFLNDGLKPELKYLVVLKDYESNIRVIESFVKELERIGKLK